MATQTELRPPAYSPVQPLVLAEDDISFDRVGAFARRHRRLLGLWAALGLAIGVSVALLLPPKYTARTSFVPQGRVQNGALASIAAQFGVAAALSGDATRTPSFYSTLLNSTNLLARVVEQPVTVPNGSATKIEQLETYLRPRGDTPGKRRASAISKLLKHMTVALDQKAGLVIVEVQLPHPSVAQAVAAALLRQVDTFNLRTRQGQASSERRFTEARLAEAGTELRVAEGALLNFLQGNRDFRSSPQLNYSYERLTRDVTLKQQIYTTLAEAYEQARIEEVRDTPVITVVDEPTLPLRPDPAPIGQAISAGLVAGFLVGALLGRRKDRALA